MIAYAGAVALAFAVAAWVGVAVVAVAAVRALGGRFRRVIPVS